MITVRVDTDVQVDLTAEDFAREFFQQDADGIAEIFSALAYTVGTSEKNWSLFEQLMEEVQASLFLSTGGLKILKVIASCYQKEEVQVIPITEGLQKMDQIITKSTTNRKQVGLYTVSEAMKKIGMRPRRAIALLQEDGLLSRHGNYPTSSLLEQGYAIISRGQTFFTEAGVELLKSKRSQGSKDRHGLA